MKIKLKCLDCKKEVIFNNEKKIWECTNNDCKRTYPSAQYEERKGIKFKSIKQK